MQPVREVISATKSTTSFAHWPGSPLLALQHYLPGQIGLKGPQHPNGQTQAQVASPGHWQVDVQPRPGGQGGRLAYRGGVGGRMGHVLEGEMWVGLVHEVWLSLGHAARVLKGGPEWS